MDDFVSVMATVFRAFLTASPIPSQMSRMHVLRRARIKEHVIFLQHKVGIPALECEFAHIPLLIQPDLILGGPKMLADSVAVVHVRRNGLDLHELAELNTGLGWIL